MSELESKPFVSVFKIEGVPILPPLITSDKRIIIKRYREEAIDIENKLKSRKHAEVPVSMQDGLQSQSFGDDFLKISSFLQSKVTVKNNAIKDLGKSDTLIYDVISNTIIIPYDPRDMELVSDLNQPLQQEINSDEKPDTNIEIQNSITLLNVETNRKQPSVVVNPPTPDTDSEICLSSTKINEIVETNHNIPASSQASDSDKNFNKPSSLIRTNSFILEKASNVLVEHMDKLALKEQESIFTTPNIASKKKGLSFSVNKSPKIIGFKKKEIQNIYDQTDMKKENVFTNTTLFKNKKSPYELENTRKTKASKKHKSPILKTSSNLTLKAKLCNSSIHKNRINENENVYSKAFEDIEKQHKLQLIELTKKHQDEQNKMKELFEYKQRLLLQHLSSQINTATLDDQNCAIDQTEPCTFYSEKNQESTKILKNNLRSRFYNKADNKSVLQEAANNYMPGSLNRPEHAATTINKYVRGYLTRRLFKTYYVQKMVLVIRDTLSFVINLHNQTKFNDNPENINLKVHLLQQLKTSYYDLHNVFFALSTKQQMTLISKDRIYKINNKLFLEEN